MKRGDKVKVIRSPYSTVKVGTVAYIMDIKYEQFDDKWKLYILDTKPCSAFRENELEIINDEST